MKNIKKLFNVYLSTYFLILTFLFTGLIKNILIIYAIIIIHECGHIFIIKVLGYKIKRVDIYPMGGVTTIEKKINSSLKHELLIAIFGILFQIILFLIISFLFKYNNLSKSTYQLFMIYNKTILLFNILPLIPLDGYLFLRAILELICPYKLSFYISFIISLIALISFITFNELKSLNNYLIISFLIYKMVIYFKDFKFQKTKFELERFLYNFNYQKIKYEKGCNLAKLKKNTYHYFKSENKVLSEKRVLEQKYGKIN